MKTYGCILCDSEKQNLATWRDLENIPLSEKNKAGSVAENHLCGLSSHLYSVSFKDTLVSKDI